MQVFPVLDSTVHSPVAKFWILWKRIGLLEWADTHIKHFPSFYLNVLLWEWKSPSLYLITKKKSWSNIFPNQGTENNTTDLILLSLAPVQRVSSNPQVWANTARSSQCCCICRIPCRVPMVRSLPLPYVTYLHDPHQKDGEESVRGCPVLKLSSAAEINPLGDTSADLV